MPSPRFRRGQRRHLSRVLRREGFALLEHGLGAFERLLPHVEVNQWRPREVDASCVTWRGQGRRALTLRIRLPDRAIGLEADLARLAAPAGAGQVSRTVDLSERAMAEQIVEMLSLDLAVEDSRPSQVLRKTFDERVVASYLETTYGLQLDLRSLVDALRRLAEQTYETRALTFGVLVDPSDIGVGDETPEFVFPQDYMTHKRYRVLSDGYRVAYRLSARGAVTGLVDLTGAATAKRLPFFPEWARDIALRSRRNRVAIALTRHGDILVFANGNLHLSYRAGQWQYWNHTHVIDLVRDYARAQRVQPGALGRLVARLYRLAPDVSFRHTGGLVTLLRNRRHLHDVVRAGDAIHDRRRQRIDRTFDESLRAKEVQGIPLPLLSELASLDGAIVVANSGELLAYGAVLEPKKRAGVSRAEGARTKAAIGASHYGVSIKVSSDGAITFYRKGKPFLEI